MGEEEIAKAKEVIWHDPNESTGEDLFARRSVELFGYSEFLGLSNEEQAELSMKLSIWFFKYARWIKSRPEGKV